MFILLLGERVSCYCLYFY